MIHYNRQLALFWAGQLEPGVLAAEEIRVSFALRNRLLKHMRRIDLDGCLTCGVTSRNKGGRSRSSEPARPSTKQERARTGSGSFGQNADEFQGLPGPYERGDRERLLGESSSRGSTSPPDVEEVSGRGDGDEVRGVASVVIAGPPKRENQRRRHYSDSSTLPSNHHHRSGHQDNRSRNHGSQRRDGWNQSNYNGGRRYDGGQRSNCGGSSSYNHSKRKRPNPSQGKGGQNPKKCKR